MLKLDRVSKFYSVNGVVTSGFSKVSLDFNLGEFVAITGESGSGKSTLLNVISGLDSYEEGEMYIFGQPTSGYGSSEMEDYRKRYIGNIFQTFNLVNNYTVYQNVELVLLLAGYTAQEIKTRVNEIIDRVGLSEYKNTKASKLSGGQKQRVAIARALAKETPIIVADEPTGNLDVASAEDIIKLLASLSKDKLIIIVTHNYEQVEPYVTRKISMHDGRIAEDKKITRKIDLAPETEDAGFREARHDGLSLSDTVRVGVRNTFSLKAKFLLLFAVLIFLCIGTISSYANYTGMKKGLADYAYGYLFEETMASRLIVSKEDGSALTDSDIAKIKEVENIARVTDKDLLQDITFSMMNESKADMYYDDTGEGSLDYWIQTKTGSINDLGDRVLVTGRLPEKADETLLLIEEDSFLAANKMDAIMADVSYIYPQQFEFAALDLTFPIKVTGIAYFTKEEIEENQKSARYAEAVMILTPEGEERMETLAFSGACSKELKAGDNIFAIGTTEWDDVILVASEEVPRGGCLVPTFIDGDRDKVEVRAYNRRYEYTKDFIVLGNGPEGTVKELFLNPEDIWEMFSKMETTQLTAIMDNPYYSEETALVIQEMGYKVLHLNKSADKESPLVKALYNVMRLGVLVMILTVLFFIIYFIIKLIFKSRNTYYSTIRMLGGSPGACSGTLLVELLTVFHIAFALCLGFMLWIRQGTASILPLYMVRLARYVTPVDYIILYVVILAMTILLAYRYSTQMFRKTAMNAYREEV